MPSIEVSLKDLEKLVGKKLDINKLQDDLFNLKLELDRWEQDSMIIELEYDRPDLISTEGIARQMKGYYGIETGLKKYEFKDSKTTVTMSKELDKYRPYAEYFIAKNVVLDDAAVKQLMQVQEKLHEVYGSNREKASIGVYDLDKTTSKFEYKAVKPEEIKFIPLESNELMNGREILSKHPKGIAFAHLLKGFDKYPLLLDDSGKVLSMPPIINSEDTKVDENTKNLFVDVTGTDEKTVNMITVILATMLAERGAVIEKVKVVKGKEEKTTPVIIEKEMKLDSSYVEKVLGLKLTPKEIVNLLEKQRFKATAKGNEIKVVVPCYRFDIMHPVDLVEEVSCAYGLNNMKPILPNVATVGERHKIEKISWKVRELMIGLGFQEVATFIMGNKEKLNIMDEKPIELLNPMSEEYNAIRQSLIPKLLEVLSNNTHHELPQKVFEAGDVVLFTNRGETKTDTKRHLAALIISPSVGFTEAKSVLEALLRGFGIKPEYKEKTAKPFLEGRTAEVFDSEKKRKIGVIGEIHPDILLKFGLENPVAGFEIEAEKLL